MPSDIKYIAETRTFIIDGKIINENELPKEKVEEYKKLAGKWNLILGECKNEGTLVL